MKSFSMLLVCVGALCLLVSAATPGLGEATSELQAGLDSWQVGYEIYQVRSGDTVENVAARFGVEAARIRAINRLDESAALAPGQSIAIVLPGRPRVKSEPAPSGELPAEGEAPQLTTFAPRYAMVQKACAISSACPPARGEVLWQCDAGTRVLVNAQQGEHYGVVMLGGSTGWLSSEAASLTDDAVTPSELEQLQKGGGSPEVVQEALCYLGTPYRYGGKLPRNVDCSLLVQTVFARHGVRLPRTAAEQCEVGGSVSVSDLQPGDRLYFINRSGQINHTALYLGNMQFVHASSNRGCVAIDSLENPYYATRFYGARRL
jgi:hypothetical protein